MVELIAMLVSSPRVGGQIASSRAVSSPYMVTMRTQVRMMSRSQRKVTVWLWKVKDENTEGMWQGFNCLPTKAPVVGIGLITLVRIEKHP